MVQKMKFTQWLIILIIFKMKIHEICVHIKDEQMLQQAKELLEKHGEKVDETLFFLDDGMNYLKLGINQKEWWLGFRTKTEITIDQLEGILKPKRVCNICKECRCLIKDTDIFYNTNSGIYCMSCKPFGATSSALTSKQKSIVNISIGAGTGLVVGTCKELYDKSKGGQFNYKDLGATVLGSALGTITIRYTIRKTI